MIKNMSMNRKSTKSDKKRQNLKSSKSEKMQKHKKWQKPENRKTQKHENQKSEKVKKWSKFDPPLKMAKMSLKWPKSTLCVFRAAWLGAFSIPGGTTGPGFKAEIRPPLFSLFFDQFLAFYQFPFYAFSCFWWFWVLWKLIIFVEVTFFDHDLCNVIRPYGKWQLMVGKMSGSLHRRGDVKCVVVSPLIVLCFYLFEFFFLFQLSGRLHRRGDSSFILSFSPLF